MDWKTIIFGTLAGYAFGGKAGAAAGGVAGFLASRGSSSNSSDSSKVPPEPPLLGSGGGTTDLTALFPPNVTTPPASNPPLYTPPELPPAPPPGPSGPPIVSPPPPPASDPAPPETTAQPPWVPTTADEALAHGWSIRGPDASGTYYAVNPNQTMGVPVTVRPGHLSNPSGGSLGFQAPVSFVPSPARVVLVNDGQDVLHWQASTDDPAVSVSPSEGILHGGQSVTVVVGVASQSDAGTRTAHVQFDAGSGGVVTVACAIAFSAVAVDTGGGSPGGSGSDSGGDSTPPPPPPPPMYMPITVEDALAHGWHYVSSGGGGLEIMVSPDGSVVLKLPHEPPPPPPPSGGGDTGGHDEGGDPGGHSHEL